MHRSYGSHVEEWASLLGERVSDDALRETGRGDGPADREGRERR